ncbi:MAG: EAL domain-containing protein [Actinomycetota bacterium]|nr:EAL domain-containing protein [Actinomycetota bacterium]
MGLDAPLRHDVAELLPDAVFVVDPDMRLQWANQAAADLFGIPVEDALGMSGMDFVHPDDMSLAAVSLTSMQTKEIGTPIEVRVRGASGWRLVEVIGRRIDDGVLMCMRDLTERRRWEIAQGTERLSALTQNALTVMLSLDVDGVVSASSGGLTRLLGIDQGWIEGRPLADLVDPADHGALLGTLERVRVDRHVTVDLRLVGADGVVPFALTFADLLDDPTLEGIIVTGHDVSDRVRSERELRTANSVLAATLDATAEGILVVGLDGELVSSNRQFLEMWRLPGGAKELDHLDDDQMVEVVLPQLSDPAAFVLKLDELRENIETSSRDTIEFRDGRVFERDTRPQRIDGEVVGRVWCFRDVTDQRRLQSELQHQAFHDPLTGLANTALFRDRVTHAGQRLARSTGNLAVLFIDLDDFKTVNDSLGHSAGDLLLVAVSERISSCLRPGDTAARLGGDEFAVLVEEVSEERDAVGVAERILEVLRSPIDVSSTKVSAGASIGIAYGAAGTPIDEILRNADLAMYTAKSAGKSCYRVFAPEMHRAAMERLDLESHLPGAADRGELELHYQPVVELATGRIRALEALLRWNHPERGRLGPLAFIPFAEEGGLISEIGLHVLARACSDAVSWSELRPDGDAPSVSVNISPRQLADVSLPDLVAAALEHSGLPAERLILEITEGALMTDPAAATTSLERLGSLGVRLAVDDFGTGYSSLAYLQRFPLDMLKIDGAFVDDDLSGQSWSLAAAIVRISEALGLVAIAEGVETQAQVDALIEIGCRFGQGYHLGRPVPLAEARRLLAETARGAG